jgi:hypothetical protein
VIKPVSCIACGTELESSVGDSGENQPSDATTFRSYGQYGSTVFDPMDGSFLEINVCDRCLTLHQDRVLWGRDYKHVTACVGGQKFPSVVGRTKAHRELTVWNPDIDYWESIEIEPEEVGVIKDVEWLPWVKP